VPIENAPAPPPDDTVRPISLEGEWWTENPFARDYFEVATSDGGRYWLYRDHADGRFYLHGVFD